MAIGLAAAAAIALVGGWAWRGAGRAPGVTPGAAVPAWAPIAVQTLSHGRFANLTVYVPHTTPAGFVLLLSGADGWNQNMADAAERLAERGAMVTGIDLAQFTLALERDDDECIFPDGDLENLSHFVQAYFRLPTYLAPVLAGYSAGATLAYAVLAQAPANTFAGAVSMDFCPSSALPKRLCKGSGLDFTPHSRDAGVDFLPSKQIANPWIVLEAAGAQACEVGSVRQFVASVPNARLVMVPSAPTGASAAKLGWTEPYSAAFDSLMAHHPAATGAPPEVLGDLPIIEVAAQSGTAPSDTFAIMLSGDGGWAGLDKEVAAALAADGIPVVGLDSLRYFWIPRTPASLAADLDRMIHYYQARLGKARVVLVGYSQGADVLPFAVNRLDPATRSRVALAAVMGMSEHALFEFHLSSWISDDNSGPATLPEVERISGTRLLCIYGEDESDSLCPKLDPKQATVVKLKGGHHFDGNYDGLAQAILASAGR